MTAKCWETNDGATAPPTTRLARATRPMLRVCAAAVVVACGAAIPRLAVAQEEPDASHPSRRDSSGLGFDLTLGALATKRDFRFVGERTAIEHHPTPYLGGAVRGQQTVATFGERSSNILVEFEGGYGSARNREPEPGTATLLVTEHTYGHVIGIFEKPLTPQLDLVLGLGVGATSFTIKRNPRYTGHRYIHLQMLFGATRWFDPWRISAGLTIQPGINTNQSAGGYGVVRSFGGSLDVAGGWRFFEPTAGDRAGAAELELRYSYGRFHSTYPESQALGDLAGSSDQNHTAVLMVTYSL